MKRLRLASVFRRPASLAPIHLPTTGSVHVRSPGSSETLISAFIVASIPAFLVDCWLAGQSLLAEAPGTESLGWRLELLSVLKLPLSASSWQGSLVVGLSLALPLLVLAALVSFFWSWLFAERRQRAVDPAWFAVAWFFVLLLPADLPPLQTALGMSFASVLGQHVFGGTGRYLVSPAALGALFVAFSYPDAIGSTAAGSYAELFAARIGNGAVSAALSEPATFMMPLACALGAAMLMRSGAMSWRLIAGGVLGVLTSAAAVRGLSQSELASIPAYWHLLLGSVPVCTAFIIGDPTVAALTRQGRWLHGISFGVFVVVIRTLDPSHPDGALFAVLLSTLVVPLIDDVIVRRRVRRARGQLTVVR